MRVRPRLSCNRCSARKVKCDQESPCSACVRHKVDCVYDSANRSIQRSVKEPAKKRPRVEPLGSVAHHVPLCNQDNPRVDNPSGSNQTTGTRGSVLPQEICRYDRPSQSDKCSASVRDSQNLLYESVAVEISGPNTATGEDTDGENRKITEVDSTYLIDAGPFSTPRTVHHPPGTQILQLWRIFKTRIDPLTKIVHVPSLEHFVDGAAKDATKIARPFSALLCAIYSTAVMSLPDAECHTMFGTPRTELLNTYITMTKAALTRANLLETTNLAVLQALVLHVYSVRSQYSPRTLYTLNGVAIRIAQCMKLDRDGEVLGLPPFQTELRRRIWWAIKGHDFQIAELCGLPKFRDLDTTRHATKFPSNIDDSLLRPEMESLPTTSDAPSDAIFVALRGEMNRFALHNVGRAQADRRTHNLDEMYEQSARKDSALDDLRKIIEDRYIRPCDPSRPLHLLTMLVARTMLNYVEFMLHHPRQWKRMENVPDEERQLVWNLALRLLEQYVMAQTNPALAPFAWHANQLVQWHALVQVLHTLRVEPSHPEANNAWKLIADVFASNPDLMQSTRTPVHVAVSALCKTAFDDRPIDQTSAQPPPTKNWPVFVAQMVRLRQASIAHGEDGTSEVDEPSLVLAEQDAHIKPTSHGLVTQTQQPTATSLLHESSTPTIHDLAAGPSTCGARQDTLTEDFRSMFAGDFDFDALDISLGWEFDSSLPTDL